jgi:hypothetical protein
MLELRICRNACRSSCKLSVIFVLIVTTTGLCQQSLVLTSLVLCLSTSSQNYRLAPEISCVSWTESTNWKNQQGKQLRIGQVSEDNTVPGVD